MSNVTGHNVANVRQQDGSWEIQGTINIDTVNGGTLTVDGTDVSAGLQEIANLSGLSSAELGVLDSVTPGTGAASKAVVLNANADVTTGIRDLLALRDITSTRTITGVDITTTGNTVLGNAAGDTVKFHGTAGSGAQSAYVASPADITGGESPTEAEFNTLNQLVAAIATCLINHGLMAAS